jgi:hypothetical protein
MAAAPTWDGFRPEAGPVIVGHAVKLSDMTETEQKYGMAPSRGRGVVYQDQVALLEHGDKAIKAAESNGLGWTLDGSDPRIAALKEGDIVFATARCVGRVLKLTRSGDDVRVILGPVQLTDIVKQGNFAYDAPLDLNALTAVELPDFPGAFGSPYFDQMKKAEGGGASRSGSTGGGSTSLESHLVIDRVAYYVVSPDGAWRPMPTPAAGAKAVWRSPTAASIRLRSFAHRSPPTRASATSTTCCRPRRASRIAAASASSCR